MKRFLSSASASASAGDASAAGEFGQARQNRLLGDIAPTGSAKTDSPEDDPEQAFAVFYHQILRSGGGIPVLIAMLEDVTRIKALGFDLFRAFSHQATEAFHALCEKKNNEDPMDEHLYDRERQGDCVTFVVDDEMKVAQKIKYAEDIMLGFVLWVRDTFEARAQKLCDSKRAYDEGCPEALGFSENRETRVQGRLDYIDEKDKMAYFLLIATNLATVFSKFFNEANAIRFKFIEPSVFVQNTEMTLTFDGWVLRLKELSIILPRFNAEALRNDQAFAKLLVENREKQLFFARPELDVNPSMLRSQYSFDAECARNMANLQAWISELSRAFELSNGITALMQVDMLNELWVKGMGRTKSDLRTFVATSFLGSRFAWIADGFSSLFGRSAASAAPAAEAAPAVAATPVPAAPAPDAAAAATSTGTDTAAALVVHQPARASEALEAATVDYAAHAAAVAQAAQNGGNNASPAGRFGCCPCLPGCC